MRRKTKAKRILDYENEEDEEEDQKLDAICVRNYNYQVFTVCRRDIFVSIFINVFGH